jgi:voltage-gated potassium channel
MTDSALARWERRTGGVLTAAALLFLASYALRVLGHDLPGPVRDLCLATTLAAWAVFLADYVVRHRLSGQRWPRFVRTHWLDTLVLLLPLLRPVRIVQTYDRVRMRRHGGPRYALHARVMLYAGVSTLLLGFAASLAVYHEERGAPGATIRTFGDSVWWACTTVSGVGYGDMAPVTPLGRLVAVGLMGCGLALLGAVVGAFSSWLIQMFADDGEAGEAARRPPGDSPGAFGGKD